MKQDTSITALDETFSRNTLAPLRNLDLSQKEKDEMRDVLRLRLYHTKAQAPARRS